ncbi:MAG: hypothetical protein HXX09_08540 [Bacteroidetes bacterium]|nr:hypothetical protein [Bacteroidota bacterium]
MQQLIINITNDSKAQTFINFLKQLDFISVEEVNLEKKLDEFQYDISESLNDLKDQKVSTWKNKKVTIKNA